MNLKSKLPLVLLLTSFTSISVITFGHKHNVVIDPMIEPTCFEPGLSEGQHCSECKQVLVKQEVLEKLEHKKVEDQSIEPTCSSEGLVGGTHCEHCGIILDSPEIVERKNHTNTLFNHGTKNEVLICNDCKNISLPQINIEVNEEITTNYSNCKISVNAQNEEYDFDDKEASIKVRGNATATLPKKPYRLKFEKKQSMLGLNSASKNKNWVLLAEYNDRTHLKNAASLFLSNSILNNNYCSDYKFVDVYINGNYNGIYLLAEQQEVGEDRVNIYKCDKNYQETDIGYFLELDTYYEKEKNYFGIDYCDELSLMDGDILVDSNFMHNYVIKSDIYSEKQKNFIQKVTQNTWNIIYDAIYNDHSDLSSNPYKTLDTNYDIVNDSNINDCKSAIEKVVDLNSFLESYLLNEIVQDPDVGATSFYFSFDASEKGTKKLRMTAPWDFDNGYLFSTDGLFLLTSKSKIPSWGHHYVNTWFALFAKTDWFLKEAANKWKERKCNDLLNELVNDLDLKYSIFSNSFDKNDNKWYGTNYSRDTYLSLINNLKGRFEFLNDYFSNIE